MSPDAGSFTIPGFLVRTIYNSPATISFTYTGLPTAFSASGLDAGAITTSVTTAAQTVLILPAQ